MDIRTRILSKGSYYDNFKDFFVLREFNFPWERGMSNKMEIFSSIKLIYEN